MDRDREALSTADLADRNPVEGGREQESPEGDISASSRLSSRDETDGRYDELRGEADSAPGTSREGTLPGSDGSGSDVPPPAIEGSTATRTRTPARRFSRQETSNTSTTHGRQSRPVSSMSRDARLSGGHPRRRADAAPHRELCSRAQPTRSSMGPRRRRLDRRPSPRSAALPLLLRSRRRGPPDGQGPPARGRPP